jgi:hypothetical protein
MSHTPSAISISIVESSISVATVSGHRHSEIDTDSTLIVSDVYMSESCASADHKSIADDEDLEKLSGASTINANDQSSAAKVLRRKRGTYQTQ